MRHLSHAIGSEIWRARGKAFRTDLVPAPVRFSYVACDWDIARRPGVPGRMAQALNQFCRRCAHRDRGVAPYADALGICGRD